MKLQTLLFALLLMPAAWASAAEVTCESIDNRRQECALDGRGEVRLIEQLSRSDCREGRDWGAGRDLVWVANGCRAVFEREVRHGSGYGAGYGSGNNAGTLRDGQVVCESIDNRRNDCALYGRGPIRLVEQLSRSDCREGYSWGADRDGVWVSSGCRGVFERSRVADADGEVTCESIDNRRQECALDGRGEVRLIEQLSRTDCREGFNWGSSDRGVWVSGGCRGVFEKDRGYGGWPGSPGYGDGNRVTCESIDNRRQECRIDTGGEVTQTRQLSSTTCVRDRNWGVGRGVVWVSGGCRAEFRSTPGNDDGSRPGRPGIGQPAQITCESEDNRRVECPMLTAGGVRLLRQLSKTRCVEGGNWGVLQRAIWVSGGCRGVFGRE